MSVVSTLRGPADASQFRIKVGRYSDRWYHDPLPADDVAPATTDAWPSASIVKSAWPKFLGNWMAQQAATCAVEQAHIWQSMTPAAAIEYISKASNRTRDQAASRGTYVHALLEALICGRPVDPLIEVEVKPWMDAARQFVADCRPDLVVAETVSISRALGVGGTIDAVLEIDGRRYLVDYKTRAAGKNGAYDDEGAQLGLYAQPDSYVIVEKDGRARRMPMPELDGGLIISIAPDGYKLLPVELPVARDLAQHLRAFWSAKNTSPIGKPVVLGQSSGGSAAPPEEEQGAGGLVGTPAPAPRPLGLVASGLVRRIEEATLEQQLELSAAQQAAGLPRLSVCPPERLPEWVQVVNAVLGEQIGAKRSVRFDRVTMANRARELTAPQGLRLAELLAANGLVRLTETADEDLGRWEDLLRQVELDLDIDDDPFVGLPSADGVHQPESKHPDLQARYEALPADLRTAVDAAKGDLPNLRWSDATPEQLQQATDLITAAEVDHEKRKGYVTSLLQDLDDETVDALRIAAGSHPLALEDLTDVDVERLEDLCAALDADLVGLTYDDDTAVIVTTDRAFDAAVEAQGSKQAALGVAKDLARAAGLPAPRSVAAALETPLIAARLARRAS